MQLALSDEAELDLENIYLYSCENWGATKAVAYLNEIKKTINTLVSYPKLGKYQTKDGQTCYGFPCQSHIIYYHIQPNTLYVLTILHKSRIPILPSNLLID